MEVEKYTEFKIFGTHESPDGGTNYYEKTGKGDGQVDFAKLKFNHPYDEFKLVVREVVTVITPWQKSNPDEQCTGSGFAHKPHGNCTGYSTDLT